MIDWKDCLLVDKRKYVWVGYSKDYPFLPVAIASTSEELAKIMGVKEATVQSIWCRFKYGKAERTRYARVLIEE